MRRLEFGEERRKGESIEKEVQETKVQEGICRQSVCCVMNCQHSVAIATLLKDFLPPPLKT